MHIWNNVIGPAIAYIYVPHTNTCALKFAHILMHSSNASIANSVNVNESDLLYLIIK